MTTVIQIDHREWKDWRNEEANGAIAKLNELLKAHEVQVEVINEPADYLDLRAISLPAAVELELLEVVRAFLAVDDPRQYEALTPFAKSVLDKAEGRLQ